MPRWTLLSRAKPDRAIFPAFGPLRPAIKPAELSGMGTLGRRTTLPGRQPQCMMHDVLPGKRSRLLRPCAAGENATGRRNTHAIVYGKYQGWQPGYGTVRHRAQ